MKKPTDLLLYEELMLLALCDEKGTLEADDTAFKYTIAAALISELLLSKHATIDRVTKRKKIIDLRRSTHTGDPLLDECIARLKSAKRRASINTWVTRFAGIKKLRHRVALQLCKHGILQADEDKVLLVFTRKIYPELNPQPERELVQRLRAAICTNEKDLDPRTTVLVALADTANVLKNVFDKQELKRHKKRIRQIAKGDLTATAAQDVIDGVMAAIMVAVMIPTLVAVTSGN
jgi:hypothetical protein